MKFKKIDCINAVLTEPLRAGEWNSGNNDECNVCAVGAIFRHCHNINYSAYIFDEMENNSNILTDVVSLSSVNNHLLEKRYLHALSCFFEHIMRLTLPDEPISNNKRYTLVHFIEAFFPDEINYK